jgi:hypothetical protein
VVAFWAFLYRASSFFQILSMSFLLAFLMMEAIALWHREGVCSSFGGSVRFRTFVARGKVGVLSGCGSGSGGVGDEGRLC